MRYEIVFRLVIRRRSSFCNPYSEYELTGMLNVCSINRSYSNGAKIVLLLKTISHFLKAIDCKEKQVPKDNWKKTKKYLKIFQYYGSLFDPTAPTNNSF
jgi:hypothetical protein